MELENLEQPVEIINGKLKDYQLVGLSWMNFMIKNGMNFVLGDGKLINYYDFMSIRNGTWKDITDYFFNHIS